MTDRDDYSELISAFLDGEVSPEEKSMIEERLVDDVDDRRLFEEMRSIRDRLKSLPQHKLGKDLSPSVLRGAERAMLSAEPTELSQTQGQKHEKTLPQDARGDDAGIVATPPIPHQRASWQTFVWAGLTVAAAVLIIVIGNWPEWERPVAMNRPGEEMDEAASAPTAPPANRAELAGAEPADEAAAAEPPAVAKGMSESKMARLGAAEEAIADGTLEQKAGSPANDFRVDEAIADNRLAAGGRGAEMTEEDSAVPQSGTRRLIEPPLTNAPAGSAPDELYAQTVTDELANIEIPTDRLLVVSLDVSPDFVRAHSLDDALARNSVSFEYAAEQLPAIREAFVAGKHRARAEEGRAVSRGSAGELDQRKRQLAMAGDGGIVVIATAPAEQLRAALKDLLRQRDEFQLAGVHAGPSTGTLQQFETRRDVLEKSMWAQPAVPEGPDVLADADPFAAGDAVTGAEAEEFEGVAKDEIRLARRSDTELQPAEPPVSEAADMPARDSADDGAGDAAKVAPGSALDSGAPVPGEDLREGVAGRFATPGPPPEMPAVAPAETPPPAPSAPAPAAPLVEAPMEAEMPEPLEEPAADPAGVDEPAVPSPEWKPATSNGALRKPSRESAKKNELNKGVAAAKSEVEKKKQVKDEDGGGVAARALDRKRGGQPSDRQGVDADTVRRQNRPDDRSRGDADDSDKPREEQEPAKSPTKIETLKTDAYRAGTSAVAGRPQAAAGGFGGGGAAVGELPRNADEFGDGKGATDERLLGRKELAAPQAGQAPQMVQVLFVLRTVKPPASITASPPADVAADVPSGQSPAAAASRVQRTETGAEAIEADQRVIEPAEPAVRE